MVLTPSLYAPRFKTLHFWGIAFFLVGVPLK